MSQTLTTEPVKSIHNYNRASQVNTQLQQSQSSQYTITTEPVKSIHNYNSASQVNTQCQS